MTGVTHVRRRLRPLVTAGRLGFAALVAAAALLAAPGTAFAEPSSIGAGAVSLPVATPVPVAVPTPDAPAADPSPSVPGQDLSPTAVPAPAVTPVPSESAEPVAAPTPLASPSPVPTTAPERRAIPPGAGWPAFDPARNSAWLPGPHEFVVAPDAVGGDAPPYRCSMPAMSTVSKVCINGDRKSRVTIALVGDSHIDQWLPVLDRMARAHHWRLVSIIHNSCPFSFAPRQSELDGFLICTVAVQAALPVLQSYHPAVVIDSTLRIGYLVNPASGVAGHVAMFDRLRSDGMRVIALGDTPNPPKRPQIRTCAAGPDPAHCGLTRAAALTPADPLLAASRIAKVPYIDPTGAFCGPKWCPGVIGDVIVYRDDSHVTNTYIQTLWPWVQTHVLPVVRTAVLARGAPAVR